MKSEAKANEGKDKEERATVEKINEADTMIYQTEKQLKEFGDKLSAGNKAAVGGALTELKAAYESKDISLIDSTLAALNTAWQAASQEMYSAEQGAGQPGAGAEQSAPSDSVTDVEFEEVDGDKK
jgi:molecular chaperone DnaK